MTPCGTSHDASAEAEKLMHESMQRPDFIEGITAFFEKRQPRFPPLKEDTPMTGTCKPLDYQAIDVDNHYYETDRLLHPTPAQGVQAPRRADGRRRQAHPGRHG